MDKITWNPMTTVKPLEPVGQRVIIDTTGDDAQVWRTGTIVGHVVIPPRTNPGEAVLSYVVELDKGFYSEDLFTHVTIFLIAADSPELRIGEE